MMQIHFFTFVVGILPSFDIAYFHEYDFYILATHWKKTKIQQTAPLRKHFKVKNKVLVAVSFTTTGKMYFLQCNCKCVVGSQDHF